MSLTIEFNDETEQINDPLQGHMNDLLSFAAEKLNIDDAELSVTFVDNTTIQGINKRYRDKDQPTDVISFALEEMDETEVPVEGDDMPRILGDIVLSVPKAEEQAKAYGHSFTRELGFLLVHGLLHLLGYDHMTETDEKEMFQLQEDILSDFGLTRSS
ncbi:rRNA maturation RNase YbeY [Tuberibacillus sp. Marseille-P3662]|uniref:rRNA maturation RNase YbeY n=1 Tax=Tuberibacillus sp. Marseille-P3662 TaxID=1965358 RepID=UPI000A1CEC05|nr:rRNA maturation RNase YbeY [Tuberibacillus sp. Marseille-P3662]